MARFDEAVVLVTGAGSAIGLATALAFAREGALLVLSDVDHRKGKAAVARVKQVGAPAVFHTCDVSQPAQVAALVDGAVRSFGRLDIAFNNAGVEAVQAEVEALAEADWMRTIAVDLNGVFFCMKRELQQMVRQERGVIINNAWMAGSVGFAGSSADVAAKHGVLGLTRTAAIEYAAHDIRVNAVGPGFIKTPVLEGTGSTGDPGLANPDPMHRLGEAAEIAEAVLFLASPAASLITGDPLRVDGGYVAR